MTAAVIGGLACSWTALAPPANAAPPPPELLPTVSLRLGVRGAARAVRTVEPWLRWEITWRLGPMSRAWIHRRANDHETARLELRAFERGED